ncbi:MAG: hypothetical protein GY803_19935 [Chloroflexi bacterium]|nr:hypothetical protein [Chloroflexota bacterium]
MAPPGADVAPGAKPHAVTHLDGAQKFWYENNGNMTRRIDESGDDWTLDWTPENMLHNASSDQGDEIGFVYDADGMMVQRNQPYQTTIFLGKLYEDDTVYGVKKQYLFSGKLVALREGLTPESDVSFILTDHLGSDDLVGRRQRPQLPALQPLGGGTVKCKRFAYRNPFHRPALG